MDGCRIGAGGRERGQTRVAGQTTPSVPLVQIYCRESPGFNQCTLSRRGGFSYSGARECVGEFHMIAWYRKTGAIGRILPPFPFNRSLSVGKAETFDSKKSFSLTVPILPNYTRSPAGRTVPHGIAPILPHLVGVPACVSPLSHLFAAVTR